MYSTTCTCTLESMLRVFEQICESDCNEAALLLCDGCDRGFHTYCFRPALAAPPAGEWYCVLCVARATASIARFCLVCGDVLDDECAQYELESTGGAHQISNSRSASASSSSSSKRRAQTSWNSNSESASCSEESSDSEGESEVFEDKPICWSCRVHLLLRLDRCSDGNNVHLSIGEREGNRSSNKMGSAQLVLCR